MWSYRSIKKIGDILKKFFNKFIKNKVSSFLRMIVLVPLIMFVTQLFIGDWFNESKYSKEDKKFIEEIDEFIDKSYISDHKIEGDKIYFRYHLWDFGDLNKLYYWTLSKRSGFGDLPIRETNGVVFRRPLEGFLQTSHYNNMRNYTNGFMSQVPIDNMMLMKNHRIKSNDVLLFGFSFNFTIGRFGREEYIRYIGYNLSNKTSFKVKGRGYSHD